MEEMNQLEMEFEHLIVHFLDNTITDDELEKLRMLLEISEKHRRQFRKIHEGWLQVGFVKAGERFDVELGLIQLRGKIKRQRQTVLLRKVFGYAAVILILLSVGGYVIYRNFLQEKEELIRVASVHSSDFGKVFLDMGIGKPVDVTEKRDTTKAVQLIEQNMSTAVEYDSTGKSNVELKWKRLFTTRGAEYSMVLSDGTKVWLNAESELKFPDRFQGECREVYLKGEAYFDVAKDAKSRFIVHSSVGEVKVLGTKFNVNNYAGENTSVTLVEGLVTLRDMEDREKKILPGEQGVFGKAGIEVRKVDIKEVVAWKEGNFVYIEKRLDDILKSLARWYDLEIFYQNAGLKEEIYTAKFERFDNVDVILRRLENVGNMKFEKKGRSILVKEKKE